MLRNESSNISFVRHALLFTFVLNTVIGVLITVLHQRVELLGGTLIKSHSIGFSICTSVVLLRLFFVRWFTDSLPLQIVIYLFSIPVGVLIGGPLGDWASGDDPHFLFGGRGESSVTIVFSLVGGIAAVLYAIVRWMVAERQRRAEQAEKTALGAQLRALQAQIEPHFLFNTLANLDALIALDAQRAREMLAHLIRYLRASLVHARSDTATLETEFELLRSYLA
ncbi:MAG: histidine kinase, partial [Roseiflexaceae bacterium]|nr:histidine kinase [Roseiflexaceae bacterium]